jgi:hypothetical protein
VGSREDRYPCAEMAKETAREERQGASLEAVAVG